MCPAACTRRRSWTSWYAARFALRPPWQRRAPPRGTGGRKHLSALCGAARCRAARSGAAQRWRALPAESAPLAQVLDEFLTQLDSLHRKIIGDSESNKNAAWTSLSSLSALIRSAKRVLVLDANAASSQVVVEFLHRCIAPECILWRRMSNLARGDDVKRVQFVFGYDSKTGGNTCVAAVVDALVERLAAGEHIAVPCSEKANALRIQAALRLRVPEVHVVTLHDPGNARDRAAMDELVAHVSAGAVMPDVLIYTSIYGVGCSYNHLHFSRIFFCLSAQTSFWEDAMQNVGRVRALLPTVSGPNTVFFCDAYTHDYEAHGAPWVGQPRQIKDADFRAKRASGVPVVTASSHKKALVLLRTAPEFRAVATALREWRETRYEFYRRHVPTEMDASKARHLVLHAAQLNHHIGGAGMLDTEEVDQTAEADLTARFIIQKRLVSWLAEYVRRESRRGLECIPRLKQALLERGYELLPDAFCLVSLEKPRPSDAPPGDASDDSDSDDGAADADGDGAAGGEAAEGGDGDGAAGGEASGAAGTEGGEPAREELVLPTKEDVLRVQAVPKSQRTPEQKRVIELGYALSILGNPDGSSFVAGGGPPDPAHAYEFDPSKHVDFKMLKQLRATSALLIESSTPEEELQRWLLHSKVRTAPVCS